MSTFKSSSPIVSRSMESFIQWVSVAGEKKRVEFEKEVLWLQQSESQLFYMHGGRVIKEGAKTYDYNGYLSSININHPSPEESAKFYDITPDSSLELVIKTSVFLCPVCEFKEDADYNKSKSHDEKAQYSTIPEDWRKEVMNEDQTLCWPTLEIAHKGFGITWSSKNTEEKNKEILDAFYDQWKVA